MMELRFNFKKLKQPNLTEQMTWYHMQAEYTDLGDSLHFLLEISQFPDLDQPTLP